MIEDLSQGSESPELMKVKMIVDEYVYALQQAKAGNPFEFDASDWGHGKLSDRDRAGSAVTDLLARSNLTDEEHRKAEEYLRKRTVGLS